MPVAQFCWCRRGLVCEAHPDRPWPHHACGSGGIRCLRPACCYGLAHLIASIATWRHEAASGVNEIDDAWGVTPDELRARADLAEADLLAWETMGELRTMPIRPRRRRQPPGEVLPWRDAGRASLDHLEP